MRSAGTALAAAALLSACGGEAAGAAQEPGEAAPEPAVRATGTPARPLAADGEGGIARTSRLISMKDMMQGDDPACHITFAYQGHEPETLIWSDEECRDLNAMFLGKAELEHHRDWQHLSQYDRERFAELPGGKVFYVEGNFTASIYPLDYNNLTYEVPVAD